MPLESEPEHCEYRIYQIGVAAYVEALAAGLGQENACKAAITAEQEAGIVSYIWRDKLATLAAIKTHPNPIE